MNRRAAYLGVILFALAASPAFAQTKTAPTPAAAAAPADAPSQGQQGATLEDALPPGFKLGPVEAELGEGLTLAVPEGHGIFEASRAKEMLKKGGTQDVTGVLGIVLPISETAKWAVVVRFSGDGYIKDDEKLDGKEILDAIKEGTEESNTYRKEKGIPALFVDAWIEEPRYDNGKHHMIWGLKGHTVEEGEFVNYNTHVLGRKGYVSLNLVSDPASLGQDKQEVTKLLNGTKFKEGERYEDFKEGTDKVAEYGLAGLVLGGAGLGAAKLVKLGILAKFGKVILAALIAGKKAVVVGVIAIVAFLKKLFGMKKDEQPQEPPAE